MEQQVERLVAKTWKKFEETPQSKRILIAVSGIPGSGKYSVHQGIYVACSYELQERLHWPPKLLQD